MVFSPLPRIHNHSIISILSSKYLLPLTFPPNIPEPMSARFAGASRWPARASSELCPLLPASSHPHLPAPWQDTAASSNPGPPQPCTPGCRICPWLSSLVPPPPPSSASVQQKGRSLCTTLRQPHAPLLLAPRRPQALQLAALPPATSRPKPPASSRQSPAVACTARRAAAVRGLLTAGRPGPGTERAGAVSSPESRAPHRQQTIPRWRLPNRLVSPHRA